MESDRDRLTRHLAQAADRFGVIVEGAMVRGNYNGTAGVRTSGPAWLRVATRGAEWAKDDMWDGIATATGDRFDDIPMPHLLRSVEWADSDLNVRADLITYIDQPTVGTGLVLDHDADLPGSWWARLHAGLEPLRRIDKTERMAINPRRFEASLRASFGVEIDRDRIDWQVVHGDLHFGNLTAPDLTILDWECWGWAPAGYDAAHLACSAVLQSGIKARVRTEFADVLGTYSGAVAQLVAATKYLRLVEDGEHPEIAAPIRRHTETIIREQLAPCSSPFREGC
jgi:hypothetical protein